MDLGRMTAYVALLRAVNVGGTGKLAMKDLSALCETSGFSGVQTYIASGNVVFASNQTESWIKSQLERGLKKLVGKPVDVLLRNAKELSKVLTQNPFADRDPKYTHCIFLDASPPQDILRTLVHQNGELVCLGKREIYVHYPQGMGKSKLKIPAAAQGTARNMNTVAKLVELLADK
jgi:uncharacterized protein (DUF1697 family)